MILSVISVLGIFFSGVLAGEEFIVRYGVQPALTTLEDRAHLLARQALVRRLRVVVPAIMVPTVLVAIAVLVATLVSGASAAALALRVAGVAFLVAFVLFSFLGTVPINIRVNDWNIDAPPSDWKATVRRWQFIDVFRSSAALLAFASFLVAAAVTG